jgi:dTDP-4-amino-4,6-dideoxygalactose transaminase
VDLFGLPSDYDRILPIAEKYGLKVLEDAAQGFGGNLRGKRAGSFGDISTTSFFPAKPLGCYGDGGAVFTDDDEVDARLRSLRAQGKSPTDKYDNREIGMNSRLDTMQAAILLPKFKAFAEYELDAVNRVAGWYTERLKDRFVTPVVPEGYYSSWAQYTILMEARAARDAMQKQLKEKGIPSMVYYPRGLHQQEAYRWMKLPDEWYPNTMEATNRVLSLPMHPYLTEEMVDGVVSAMIRG